MNSAPMPAKSTVHYYAILLLLLLSTYQAVASNPSTTTTVASSNATSTLGDTVTFTATVSSTGSGTPTGLVTFFDGATPLGSGTLSVVLGNDQATFSTSLLSAAGSPHSITATYQGDSNFNSSTSAAVSQTVNPRSSTTGVVLNPTSVVVGQPSTATVTVTDGGSSNPPGTPDTFTATGAPATSRTGFTATLFADGKVLVAGGTTNTVLTLTQVAVGTKAVYSYSSFTGPAPGVGMSVAFSGFVNAGNNVTATLTAVSGGASGTVTVALTTQVNETDPGSGTTMAENSAEIYSVSGAAFTATGSLNTARSGAVAVLLPNGKILVAGGSSDGTPVGALSSAELFDPNTGTFTTTGTMTAPRFGAIATLLNNGQVLLAGGGNSGGSLNSAELYNPATGVFTATGNMTTARPGASATLLGSGKVLIAGGSSTGDAEGALSSAELFDPTAGTFTAIASSLSTARWEPAAALLLSGKVLIAGGQNIFQTLTSADLYDPVANTFSPSAGLMAQARVNGSAVALPNGTVLLAGGVTPASTVAELYDADGDRFDATGSLVQTDNGLVATLLNNGQVLAVGLTNASTPASDAELYSPSFNPLGTVGFSSSEATDTFGARCVLTPSSGSNTASTCTSTVTATNIATSPHTITSTYLADSVHSTSNNTASLTVTAAATSTTVASSLNPSGSGQSVTFTATVTNSGGSAAAPTGTVQFVVDSSNFGSPVTLTPASSNSSTASISTSTLTVGTHTVAANYTDGPDGNFTNSSGTLPGGQVVNSTFQAPPTIAKAFNPVGIQPNGVSTLTITLTNPSANTQALTGVAFTDNFPTNVAAASPNGLTNSCGGTATAGSNSVSLSGGTIAVSSSCAVTINVTSAFTGSYLNTTGAVNSTNGGAGGTASATLGVAFAPTISKLFLPSSIANNQSTLLSFAIQNPNSNSTPPNSDVTLTGISFTDNLPAGLVVASVPNVNNDCGGTFTAVPGATSVTLTGGTIAPAVGLISTRNHRVYRSIKGLLQAVANGACFPSVEVTANVSSFPGGNPVTLNNTTGAISANESGQGATSNTASVTVSPAPPVAAPTIAKAFGASSVPLNGTTSLTLTFGNPNSSTNFTNVSVNDPLPSGLVVASPNGLGGTCLADGATVFANPGSNDINTVGTSLSANTSCTVVVNVTGTTAGAQNNTTGNVNATYQLFDSDQSISGGTASATLIVVAPPSIAKAFNPSSIGLTQTTSLGFTITNPTVNTVALTGVGFTDTLPSGLTVANGTSSVCGGTLAITGGNTIALSGATVAASGTCVFSVPGVANNATTFTTFTNTTGNVSSANGGTGNVATANLTVFPVVVSPASVNFGDVDSQHTVSTVVTITNKETSTISLSISLTPGTGANANNFSFSTKCPSSLRSNQSCTVTVTFVAPNVTSASQLGVSTATLNVTSVGQFTEPVPLTANVIAPEPQFTPASLNFGHQNVNTSTTLTTTLSNVGLSSLTIVGFTISGNNPGDFSFTSFCPTSLAPSNSCNINVTFTPSVTGNRDAKLVLSSNDEGGEFVPISGVGTLPGASISAPMSISADAATLQITPGSTASMGFKVQSMAGEGTLMVTFSGALPPGVTVSLNPANINTNIETSARVTLTAVASASASLAPQGRGGTPPLYAALFPVLGIVGLVFGKKRSKLSRLRLALIFAGLMILMMMLGCGGRATTPTTGGGFFPLSVTATSTTTGHTASTTVTLQMM